MYPTCSAYLFCFVSPLVSTFFWGSWAHLAHRHTPADGEPEDTMGCFRQHEIGGDLDTPTTGTVVSGWEPGQQARCCLGGFAGSWPEKPHPELPRCHPNWAHYVSDRYHSVPCTGCWMDHMTHLACFSADLGGPWYIFYVWPFRNSPKRHQAAGSEVRMHQ